MRASAARTSSMVITGGVIVCGRGALFQRDERHCAPGDDAGRDGADDVDAVDVGDDVDEEMRDARGAATRRAAWEAPRRES